MIKCHNRSFLHIVAPVHSNAASVKKVCSRKMYLEQHEVIHTANRRFQCNTCGLKFCKLYQLTRHRKKAHKGSKPSPKMFIEEEGMEEELDDYDEESEEHFVEEESYDEEKKSHVCHFCNAVCDTRENLLSHEKSHSSDGQEVSYTCKFCPMMFYRRTEYERHERTHTGERPYKCNICSKTFNRTWNLKIHKLNVHGIKSSRFSTGMEITPVVKSPPQIQRQPDLYQDDVGGDVKNEYTCKFCGKHLMSEWSLRVHERTHLQQEGVHQCRVCGIGFNREWDLKQHLWSEHKGRMNAKTCNICQKEFANPSNLRKHLKQVHLIKNPFVSKYSLPTDLPDIKDEDIITVAPAPRPQPRPQPPPVSRIKTENLYSLKCDKCGKRFGDHQSSQA
ncbi:uncharacterized protein [Amphiura filiformis]|uniref:uncharacterized protein n=1 Tax=Amphiura filiformis TaxID=82378 RepID=UPI003B21573B